MSNQIKVTLTIIVAIIVAYIGYRFMEGLPVFHRSKTLYTYYKKVSGLNKGGSIYISGVQVGTVKDIKLEGRKNVKVALSLDPDVKVNKGSVAKLGSNGLLGDEAITIEKGESSKEIPNGGTITGTTSKDLVSSLEKNGSKLADEASKSFTKLNHTIGRLQKVVNKKNRKNIEQMVANLKVSTAQLATLMKHQRGQMEETITHANRTLANFDTLTTKNKGAIDSTMTGLNQTVSNFKDVSGKLKGTNAKLNSILTKVDSGKGSAGKLVNDSTLYNNLDSLSVNLTKLINNVSKNPVKYLRGIKLFNLF